MKLTKLAAALSIALLSACAIESAAPEPSNLEGYNEHQQLDTITDGDPAPSALREYGLGDFAIAQPTADLGDYQGGYVVELGEFEFQIPPSYREAILSDRLITDSNGVFVPGLFDSASNRHEPRGLLVRRGLPDLRFLRGDVIMSINDTLLTGPNSLEQAKANRDDGLIIVSIARADDVLVQIYEY